MIPYIAAAPRTAKRVHIHDRRIVAIRLTPRERRAERSVIRRGPTAKSLIRSAQRRVHDVGPEIDSERLPSTNTPLVQPRVRHDQPRLVDDPVVVEQQVEVDRPRRVPHAPLAPHRPLDRVQARRAGPAADRSVTHADRGVQEVARARRRIDGRGLERSRTCRRPSIRRAGAAIRAAAACQVRGAVADVRSERDKGSGQGAASVA